jgi:hypothetical protein
MSNVRVVFWVPLVPVMARLRDDPDTPERPLTVNVLVSPGLMEAGLNAHAAGEIVPGQVKVTESVNELGAATDSLKVVESVDLLTVADAGSDLSEKTAKPLPLRLTL